MDITALLLNSSSFTCCVSRHERTSTRPTPTSATCIHLWQRYRVCVLAVDR